MNATPQRRLRPVLLALAAAALLALGFLIGQLGRPAPETSDQTTATPTEPAASIWTCSMHPQIRETQAGQCPICGMALIPVEAEEEPLTDWQLQLSPRAQMLASIETAPVARQPVSREIRMVGKIEYDEKMIGVISARVSGRIDKLYVDFTGVRVRKDDHLVSIYSPDLLATQQELLEALRSTRSGSAALRDTAQRRLEAVREKLRLLGLNPGQIDAIERRGTASDQLTLYADMAGVVIEKHVSTGMYVKEGAPIYTIADLSRVWVKLDAYEDDLAWLRYGLDVSFETLAYPGRRFEGKVVFIDPALNPVSRTVKVRLNVENPAGELKPDMFVRAVVYAKINAYGQTMDPNLKGKWVSPMHPEIVKDGPGSCDVCGMPLARAEDLGLAPSEDPQPEQDPLTIPDSAPLITGKRAIVYVALADRPGVFEGREVTLGPRAGDRYVALDGLEEGERVVVNGNFKIDSELQLLGRRSMMSPDAPGAEPEKPEPVATSPEFERSFHALWEAYFRLQTELSQDRGDQAGQAAADLAKALADVNADTLDDPAAEAWRLARNRLEQTASPLSAAETIAALRKAFQPLSDAFYEAALQFGAGSERPIFRFHCPMAFDNQGADWLQEQDQTANPYFGASMLRCGALTETLNRTDDGPKAKGGHRHEP